jgi:hypothetical protein
MSFEVTQSGLILPDDPLDATQEYESPERVARDGFENQWFRRELKSIDANLDLIFVKPGAKSFPHDCRYYIIRNNPDGSSAHWVIQSADGGYSPPTWAHLMKFQQGDSAKHPRLWEEFQKNAEKRKKAAEKERQELSREFQEKLLERLNYEFDGAGILIDAAAKQKVHEGSMKKATKGIVGGG